MWCICRTYLNLHHTNDIQNNNNNYLTMLHYMHQQESVIRASSYRRFVSRCWRNCPSWLHARTSRLGSQSMWITRLIASNRIAFLAFECCTFLDFGGSCDLLSIVSIHSVSLDRTVGSSETFATWVNMTMGHFTFWLSSWPSFLAEPKTRLSRRWAKKWSQIFHLVSATAQSELMAQPAWSEPLAQQRGKNYTIVCPNLTSLWRHSRTALFLVTVLLS